MNKIFNSHFLTAKRCAKTLSSERSAKNCVRLIGGSAPSEIPPLCGSQFPVPPDRLACFLNAAAFNADSRMRLLALKQRPLSEESFYSRGMAPITSGRGKPSPAKKNLMSRPTFQQASFPTLLRPKA